MKEVIFEVIFGLAGWATAGVLAYFNIRFCRRVSAIERQNKFLTKLSEKIAAAVVAITEQTEELAKKVVPPPHPEEKRNADTLSDDIAKITGYSPSPKRRMEQKREAE